jgi:hypothetical protein
MSDLTPQQLEEFVQRHVDGLREFFPEVQILVSHELETGETASVFKGAGNWYARQGMAKHFLDCDQAETLAYKMPKPPPDDDEEWKNEQT